MCVTKFFYNFEPKFEKMSEIVIKTVDSKLDLKRFIDFHYKLYSGNKYDAPNLFSDEWFTLSRDKNSAFEFCEVEYFLAYKDGKIVGRVAAIINHRANEKWAIKAVRFGWIDFIDDEEVSKALMDSVEKWGRDKGMEIIQGPLGFTDMDPEGMLSEGFEELGTMPTIYNYPYYTKHFDKMPEFYVENKYVEFKMSVPKEVPDKYARIAEVIQDRYNLRIKKITKDDVFKRGYGQMIFSVINQTYSHLYGYSELSENQIKQYTKMYLSYINLDLVCVIEDHTAEPKVIGIGICIPSLTKALQKCRKGRLLPFGWWHVLRAMKFKKSDSVDMLLVGILPEYRKKGANALLFYDLIPRFNEYGFKWAETQVEMADNTSVQNQWIHVNPILHKRRNCYAKKL